MNTEEITKKLLSGIVDIIQDEDNENFIDLKEVDLNEFFHALANLTPCIIYEKITGDQKDLLEFNHIANNLCFQYMSKKE